ncbi:hypothetical protein [Arsukibacterium sp. MJ3]|uniref:hypothetical protein n=1 Tax=Arsukibacterium sp. MJ3 TaxID=1632859 RepID=UPI001910772F|nr:hypothetical protein [Arsukibacterium sp. MJ3]
MTMFCLPKVPVSRAWYVAIVFLLSGCIAPALLFSPQGQLMWALLKPLVGLDPNEVNLFEQPLIKSRVQSLLGANYDTTVSLLKTANEIQQEGPLFYLVSRHTPIPLLAEKAGLVWNADTNQLAVLLVTGGAPQIFAEHINKQAEQLIPSWPKALADYADPAALQQKAISAASNKLYAEIPAELNVALAMAADPKAAIALQTNNLTQKALSPLQQQQAEARVQLNTAEQAVTAAEIQAQQAELQLQQSLAGSEAFQLATGRYSAAQQQLLRVRQALEVAKAKNKALATVAF